MGDEGTVSSSSHPVRASPKSQIFRSQLAFKSRFEGCGREEKKQTHMSIRCASGVWHLQRCASPFGGGMHCLNRQPGDAAALLRWLRIPNATPLRPL